MVDCRFRRKGAGVCSWEQQPARQQPMSCTWAGKARTKKVVVCLTPVREGKGVCAVCRQQAALSAPPHACLLFSPKMKKC